MNPILDLIKSRFENSEGRALADFSPSPPLEERAGERRPFTWRLFPPNHNCEFQIHSKAMMSILCLLFFAPLLQVHAADEKPRIEGIIMGNKGVPLSNAMVAVFSAKPREGEGTLCAECYPDCGKHVRTDASGRFVIEPLNPDLLYRLAVLAKAYRPDYIKDADPTFGDVELRLKPRK